MAKIRTLSFAVLSVLFVILMVTPLMTNNGTIGTLRSVTQTKPNDAQTPIPNTYTQWFNGSSSPLNGYTSFYNNTPYSSLNVNNSYSYPTFHNGTIDLSQLQLLPNYNIYAVNVSIYNNAATAIGERDSTASPQFDPTNPDLSSTSNNPIQTKFTGSSHYEGLAQNFSLPLLANLTEIQTDSQVNGFLGSDDIAFQLRNDTSGTTLNTYSSVLFNKSLASAGWSPFNWNVVNTGNLTFSSGEYFLCYNGTWIPNKVGETATAYVGDDSAVASSQYEVYQWNYLTPAYQPEGGYPFAIRWQYVPLNPLNTAQNQTFNLSDVNLAAMANYQSGGSSAVTPFASSQSVLLTAPVGQNIQNVTLTSNMSCSLQYNLTLFYNATAPSLLNTNFNIQRFTNIVSWNVSSPAVVAFPTGRWFQGAINITGLPSTTPYLWSLGVVAAYNGTGNGAYTAWNYISFSGGVLSAFNLTQSSQWWFNFTSSNFLQDINASIYGGGPVTYNSIYNAYNITAGPLINFTAAFTNSISTGELTIATYNITDQLVYGGSNASLATAGFFGNVSSGGLGWDTLNTSLVYGNYTVQMRWNDSWGVGFVEKNYSLWMAPQLAFTSNITNNPILLTPSNDLFNLTLNYTDPRVGGTGIVDNSPYQTTIYVGINGSLNYSTTATYNGTAGFYNVTLYWGQNITTYGPNYVNITTTRPFAQNASIIFNATYENATVGGYASPVLVSVVNGNSANFNVTYDYSATTVPITGATFSCGNTTFQPSAAYIAPYYQVSFGTSLIAGQNAAYQLTFNLTRQLNQTQAYSVQVQVLNKTVVNIVAINQITDYSYGWYNDTGNITSAYYGSPTDIVTAYYGAPFNVTAQFFDRNASAGIINASGSLLANLTIVGQVSAQAMYAVTSSGNYSTNVNSILPVADYVAWVNFSDPSAWNATSRTFTIRILPCPTFNSTFQMLQPNYSATPITNVSNAYTVDFGANLQIAWQLNVSTPLNRTAISGQVLNAAITLGATWSGTSSNPDGNPTLTIPILGWAPGTYNLIVNLNQTGYVNATTLTLTLNIVACPTFNSTLQVLQPGYYGSMQISNLTGSYNVNYGADVEILWQLNISTTINRTAISGQVLNATVTTGVGAPWGNSTSLPDGAPQLWMPFTGRSVGSYTVILNLSQWGYQNQTLVITIDITIAPTAINYVNITQPNYSGNTPIVNVTNTYTVYFGADLNITGQLNNTLTNSPLNTNLNATLLGTSYLSVVPGQVNVSISGLNVGIYTIVLNLTQTGFGNQSISFSIDVIRCPTVNGTVQVRQDTYNTQVPIAGVGDVYSVFFGADVQVQWNMTVLTASNTSVVPGQFLNQTNTPAGWPQVTVPTAGWALGTYYVVLNLNQTGYGNHTVTLTLIIQDCPTVNGTVFVRQDDYQIGAVSTPR